MFDNMICILSFMYRIFNYIDSPFNNLAASNQYLYSNQDESPHDLITHLCGNICCTPEIILNVRCLKLGQFIQKRISFSYFFFTSHLLSKAQGCRECCQAKQTFSYHLNKNAYLRLIYRQASNINASICSGNISSIRILVPLFRAMCSFQSSSDNI